MLVLQFLKTSRCFRSPFNPTFCEKALINIGKGGKYVGKNVPRLFILFYVTTKEFINREQVTKIN